MYYYKCMGTGSFNKYLLSIYYGLGPRQEKEDAMDLRDNKSLLFLNSKSTDGVEGPQANGDINNKCVTGSTSRRMRLRWREEQVSE